MAILDGNVKRVLTRVLAFGADLAVARNENALWAQATGLLPQRAVKEAMPRYTQGLMDLGSTICLARNPMCLICPVHEVCAAYREGRPQDFPVKTRKLKRSSQSIWLLWAQTPAGAVWLGKRPVPGVWAGLYCMPLFDSHESLELAVPVKYRVRLEAAEVFLHVLTHKDLHLHPVRVTVPQSVFSNPAGTPGEGAWFNADQWPAVGLPAPIRKLLQGT